LSNHNATHLGWVMLGFATCGWLSHLSLRRLQQR